LGLFHFTSWDILASSSMLGGLCELKFCSD
jgi:hypothetical protein